MGSLGARHQPGGNDPLNEGAASEEEGRYAREGVVKNHSLPGTATSALSRLRVHLPLGGFQIRELLVDLKSRIQVLAKEPAHFGLVGGEHVQTKIGCPNGIRFLNN